MGMRIWALGLAMVLLLGLAGCGQRQGGEETGLPADSLKAGLLLYGSTEDPYDQGHVTGLEEACRQLGLDPDNQLLIKENVPEDEGCMQAIEELIGQGCQVIFADAMGHESYLVEAALRHPEVTFCHAAGYQGASDSLDNTHNYFAKIQEARYLSGIAAGLRTKTNTLGFVASRSYAEMISAYTAFYLGAKSVNPDVTMLVNYTNEWSDATKEATNAQALIDQGCDVISQHSDTSAPATTAENNGVFAVGYNDDMISVAPNAALVSARINWGSYYEYALGCLLSGEAIAQDWCGSYAENACYLSDLNEAIIAEGTKEAIEAAAAGITDGSVQVFAGPLHGVNANGDELNLAEGEFYTENESSSAPAFDYIIDGITVLS